jgi:hypothetical protein
MGVRLLVCAGLKGDVLSRNSFLYENMLFWYAAPNIALEAL